MTSTTAAPIPLHRPLRGASSRAPASWRFSSLALITLPWLILYFGGIFTPGLLDDVDSVYIEVAREMLLRHDFVTPFIDGIRFFDKPPLMYWLAAGSMHLFGVHDWAARLPLALGVLALLFAVYALGIRLFAAISPAHAPDRGGLYAALAMALSIGPWLYTRFYIPDILIALWMTLAVHLFLIALDEPTPAQNSAVILSDSAWRAVEGPRYRRSHDNRCAPFSHDLHSSPCSASPPSSPSTSSPRASSASSSPRLRNPLPRLHPPARAPPQTQHPPRDPRSSSPSLSPGTSSPRSATQPSPCPPASASQHKAGWAWFYLYNEHIARFLGRRIPHDYGQVPIPIFWLLLILWLFPWAAFLPTAVIGAVKQLLGSPASLLAGAVNRRARTIPPTIPRNRILTPFRINEACLALLLWAGIILGFFTISSRQEYYHLPALPALALLVGGLLAAADPASKPVILSEGRSPQSKDPDTAWFTANLSTFRLEKATALSSVLPFASNAGPRTLRASLFGLVPIGAILFVVCGYFALLRPRTASRRHPQRPPQLQPRALQPLARPRLRSHRLRHGLLPLAAHRRRPLRPRPRPHPAPRPPRRRSE